MAGEENAEEQHEHTEAELGEERQKMEKNFAEAGRIAGSILREVPKLALPGESFLDIAESLEKMIIDAGGRPKIRNSPQEQ